LTEFTENLDKNCTSNSDTKHNRPYITSIITICQTENCEECPGTISNEVLHHKFVCMCPCHVLNSNNAERKTFEQKDDQ
jgi:hypothetical protein